MTPRTTRAAVAALLCSAAVSIAGAAGFAADSVTLAPVGTIPGPADLVDISNPASPMRRGAYTFPEKIWGFRVVGSLVYVADDFFGLGILDVSNAAAPALLGSFKTPGQAKNVAVFGTKAVVADHMSGVDLIDVSDRARPVSLGSFFVDGYARDVVVAGSLAYAVDAPAGLYVFDLSKPGPLDAVSTQQSATAPGSIVVSEGSGTQGPKVAVLVGGGSLQVYDLSAPAAPVRAATHRTPRVVGAYKTPNPARDVAVAGSLVLVVAGPLPQGNVPSGGGEVLILRRTP